MRMKGSAATAFSILQAIPYERCLRQAVNSRRILAEGAMQIARLALPPLDGGADELQGAVETSTQLRRDHAVADRLLGMGHARRQLQDSGRSWFPRSGRSAEARPDGCAADHFIRADS